MTRFKPLIKVVLGVVLVFASASPSFAAIIRDQFFDADVPRSGGVFVSDGQFIAQRFTVDVTGTLDSVGLQVYRSGFGNLYVDILDVGSRGTPADALATVVVPSSRVPLRPNPTPVGFVDVDFSSFGVQVEQGDILAIGLRGTRNSQFLWRFSIEDLYPHGTEFSRFGDQGSWRAEDTDVGFVTYVNDGIPEPSSALLFLVGAAVLFWSCRFRSS